MATGLPELRQHIAQYLDFDTLKAFSLVCKAWYLDARPLLWSRVDCLVPQECSASPEEYALWLDTIRKNSISFRHIRNIGYLGSIAPEIRDILLGRCHSLVSITMQLYAYYFQGPVCCWEETLRPLFEQNSVTLRQLELRWNDYLSMTFLPSVLANLSHLRSLELVSAMGMMMEDVFAILDGCPSSLERLSLYTFLRRNELGQGDSIHHPDYSSIPSIAKSFRLKSLRMPRSGIQGSLEDILSHLAAHSLQDLRIDIKYRLRISPTVRESLWRLTSLTVQDRQSGQERALPEILEAIRPHQLCRVNVDSMTTECVAKLIEKQHQSLESLNVIFEKGHTGALADILATCARLKRLIFWVWPFVNIGTLIDPQKLWVCTELEVFEGSLGLAHPIEPHVPDPLVSNKSLDTTGIEEQFMLRLGQLTNLRCVVQKGRSGDFIYDPVAGERMKNRMLEWSLASGLAHLHGLVHLRTFKVLYRRRRKWIGVPEMMFIKQHWTSLKEMVCNDVGVRDVQEWLATEWPELEASTVKK